MEFVENQFIPQTFEDFIFESILNEIPDKMKIVILGRFDGKEGKAIILFEKLPWDINNIHKIMTKDMPLKLTLKNEQYGQYSSLTPISENNIIVHIIYPATERDIEKYTKSNMIWITETADDYINITKPYILSFHNEDVQWIKNILTYDAEIENVIGRDDDFETGFVLAKDWKWDGKLISNLYLLAIVNNSNIKTIRDLNGTHLPLLRNMQKKIYEWVYQKYNITSHNLKIFFHYQPSYYHLHAHIIHINNNNQSSNNATGLERLIDNLTIFPEYYTKCTMWFNADSNSHLAKAFSISGKLLI